MDLDNFESTSVLAIQAVYDYFWSLIPSKYKLENDLIPNDLEPFYDPTLTFENRLHYKLTQIEYPKRDKPWFIITWNTENGLINSSLNRRRYQSAEIDNKKLGPVRFKFINTDLRLNLGICCNSMAALFELQENIVLKIREKVWVDTKPHSIIGSFPVSLNVIESNQNKLGREKGTLCYLILQITVDYPIIENLQYAGKGIIKEIHSSIRSNWVEGEVEQDILEYASDNITCDNHITLGEGKHNLF